MWGFDPTFNSGSCRPSLEYTFSTSGLVFDFGYHFDSGSSDAFSFGFWPEGGKTFVSGTYANATFYGTLTTRTARASPSCRFRTCSTAACPPYQECSLRRGCARATFRSLSTSATAGSFATATTAEAFERLPAAAVFGTTTSNHSWGFAQSFSGNSYQRCLEYTAYLGAYGGTARRGWGAATGFRAANLRTANLRGSLVDSLRFAAERSDVVSFGGSFDDGFGAFSSAFGRPKQGNHLGGTSLGLTVCTTTSAALGAPVRRPAAQSGWDQETRPPAARATARAI